LYSVVKKVSIFNEVMGPIMRGPSSSHTAASQHIGSLIRDLLDDEPHSVKITFAKGGSYAEVYHQQGSDLGFATGLMGRQITNEGFFRALEEARESGLSIEFDIAVVEEDDHPNAIEIHGASRSGKTVRVTARSVGGGAVELRRFNGWQVNLTGDAYDHIVEAERAVAKNVVEALTDDGEITGEPVLIERGNDALVTVKRLRPLESVDLERLETAVGVRGIWKTRPIMFPKPGAPLFKSGEEMIKFTIDRACSLGEAALSYEARLLHIAEREAIEEMWRRYEIMHRAVECGLNNEIRGMQLLEPSAREIFKREEEGLLPIGGLHTKAAARAMAAMHVNSSMGVVCAAPTGGAAGTIPGVIVTLVEEKKLSKDQAVLALFAASAVGLILANRGTFAAEVAGCQVEIGAAGAMASAAVLEALGGSAQQALDAAAISFQNTMGSVCDLVQGIVEIPCHTRNAVAASSAFVCADLILGGYRNPVPIDETIDAVMQVGRMLPRELRCTARGGLATTPSAMALKRLR
jgi:L-serine dehydratase